MQNFFHLSRFRQAFDLSLDDVFRPGNGLLSPEIRAPRWQRHVNDPAEDEEREVAIKKSRHVLVVEDDPLHRDLISRIVIRAGFETHTAHDGEEGWLALCRLRYALVIVDHEMPRLSGLGLIERLRAVSPAPPCILISVSLPAPESVLHEKVRPGAVIAKPFAINQLVETIHKLTGPEDLDVV